MKNWLHEQSENLKWWIYRHALRFVCRMSEDHRRFEEWLHPPGREHSLGDVITETLRRRTGWRPEFRWEKSGPDKLAGAVLDQNPLLCKLREMKTVSRDGGKTILEECEHPESGEIQWHDPRKK